MDTLKLNKECLRLAREAFNQASTLSEDKRLEVYIDKGKVKLSDIMENGEEILYNDEKFLCYQVYGNNSLEEEIKSWIDQTRIPKSEEDPIKNEALDKAILETLEKIAKEKGVEPETISSNEVFANLSFDLIEQIEGAILEYWWSGEHEENAMSLARMDIEQALENIKAQ